MHTSKHSQTKKYRILHSKQLSHTHTQSNTRVTDTIIDTTTSTHTGFLSPAAAYACTHTHTATATQTQGTLLATSPLLASPLPPRYHTQSRRHRHRRRCRQTGLHPVPGEPPPAQPVCWSLRGQVREGEAVHCLRVGPLLDSWATLGTKGVAQGFCALGPLTKPGGGGIGGCLKLSLFYSGWGGVESQARDLVLRRGCAWDTAQGLGGCCAQGASEAWGQAVLGVPPCLGVVGKLYAVTPSLRPCLGSCCAETPLGRER